MIGKLSILGKTYTIAQAELHLPVLCETRLMYMSVAVHPDGGFGLWDLDLARLASLDDLDGKRIHIRWEGEAFEDDTLGTDSSGVVTDHYLQVEDKGYGYREIQVDFASVQGHQYRVEVRLILMTDDDDPASDITATADFMVIADEQDPFADSR